MKPEKRSIFIWTFRRYLKILWASAGPTCLKQQQTFCMVASEKMHEIALCEWTQIAGTQSNLTATLSWFAWSMGHLGNLSSKNIPKHHSDKYHITVIHIIHRYNSLYTLSNTSVGTLQHRQVLVLQFFTFHRRLSRSSTALNSTSVPWDLVTWWDLALYMLWVSSLSWQITTTKKIQMLCFRSRLTTSVPG